MTRWTITSQGLPTQRPHNIAQGQAEQQPQHCRERQHGQELRDEDSSSAAHSVRQKARLSTTSNHNVVAQHNAAAETGR